jgi:hypothetical protein
MDDPSESELAKRADDIKAIRRLLVLADDFALIHPWAFFAWAAFVAGGAALHYARYVSESISVNSALLSIWLPVIILGAIAEICSWIIKLRKQALPLFSRRLGGMLLGALAMVTVLGVGAVRIAQTAPSPGLIVLFAVLPLVFYAQACYGPLFIETFSGIAVGICLEASGLSSPALFLASGLFVAAVFAASGLHVLVIERRRRG